MPYDEVFNKYGAGKLHSGSKTGPVVKSRKQAIAIFMSEKKKTETGNTEYQSPREHIRHPGALSRVSRKR